MLDEIKKIEKVLTDEYSNQNYVELVQEIFDKVEFVAPDSFNKEYSNFSTHIVGNTHIGNYNTSDDKKVLIMSVQLKKEAYVENSRSTQRSYAKKLIEAGNFDAALVAFYTEGEVKWRLSFVRLDYEMKFDKGNLKVTENLTPAKRYSFLVGKDEPCHTAIDRLKGFISNRDLKPSLDELEDSFSVEKVTNEFFELYCEKYQKLRESLEANEEFVMEAEQHNFTSEQFAKKLMGQIVFLYFLQKKGWLGVKAWKTEITEKEYKNAFFARGSKSRELIPLVYKLSSNGNYRVNGKALDSLDDKDEEFLSTCVKGNAWGTGPKNFMRKLFELAKSKNANFYDDYLEPLFYDALNRNRGEQGYCPALHCRIPFLSGGLFEPIDGYEWEVNNFNIPNEVFSNRTGDNARDGDGILDIFDRYNFTMSEDEPMEREVAIDPEMLGKVFENLLEIRDRKSKGAFYTPREIVHYMCQESLINYLVNTTGINAVDIRDFILYGDFMKDEDTSKEKRQGNGGMYIADSLFKIDDAGNIVVNKLIDIDNALANVRVADPAVGSGAFPLGMLNEIVRTRQNISAYFAIGMKPFDIRNMYAFDRSPYTLKYNTIKNCIFAADIEPSAVDIAQLRLWLSLVIDDEINPNATSLLDGHRNPTPLPNLECNIICGNSLLSDFEGIELIHESELLHNSQIGTQIAWGHGTFESILTQLLKAQNEIFNCDDTEKKEQLKVEIQEYKNMIINVQMEAYAEDVVQRYHESTKLASKPYVLWQLDFAKVFQEKGGFDIIIGNPPYIQLQKRIDDENNIKLGDLYEHSQFETFAKTGDIYCLFYEKGYQLLREKGVLTFITSNKWMRAGYGEPLRDFLANNSNPIKLIDFAGQKIFETATVDVNILLFEKNKNEENTLAYIAKEECRNNLSVYVEQNGTKCSFNTKDSWVVLSPIEQSIKLKTESLGTPLNKWNITINYGIKTGFNEAFIIDGTTKDALISADPKSAEIIRPILRGRDIRRYGYNFADLWLIATFPSRQYNIDDYPAVKDHLLSFGVERLEQTGATHFINGEKVKSRKKTNNKWFETQDSISYWDDFSKQKIVYPNMTKYLPFVYDDCGYVTNQKCFIITGKHMEYLTAFFNSSLFKYCFRDNFPELLGGTRELSKIFFDKIPVKEVDDTTNNQFGDIVKDIQFQKLQGKDTKELEILVDNMIFNLYNLSPDECKEIGFIEIK